MKQMDLMGKSDKEAFGAPSTDCVEELVEAPAPTEEAEEITRKFPVALRLLRSVELLGLQVDHATTAKNRTGEEWYVGREGVVQGPVTFREILDYLLEGGGSVNVIHQSEVDSEEAQWMEMDYTPFWTRPWVARIWTAAFWALVALLVYCVIEALIPSSIRHFAQIGSGVILAGLMGYSLLKRSPATELPEAASEEEAAS